jgi:hypothetical protein
MGQIRQGAVVCGAAFAQRFTRNEQSRNEHGSEQIGAHQDRGREQQLACIADS